MKDDVDKRTPSKLRAWFTLFWLLWIASFMIVEGWAIKDKRQGDTLSSHVWWSLSQVEDLGPFGKAGRAVLSAGIIGLFVWLVPHFTLGWW